MMSIFKRGALRSLICILSLVVLGLAGISANAQGQVMDEEDEISVNDEAREIVKEIRTKILELAGLRSFKQSVILMCKTFSLKITLGKLLDKEIPLWEELAELLIEAMLPETNRNGTNLNTYFDKELIRDINQTVEVM